MRPEKYMNAAKVVAAAAFCLIATSGNSNGIQSGWGANAPDYYTPRTVTRFRALLDEAAADTFCPNYGDANSTHLWNGEYNAKYAYPQARHNGRAHFLFADGRTIREVPSKLKGKKNMLTNARVQSFYYYFIATQRF